MIIIPNIYQASDDNDQKCFEIQMPVPTTCFFRTGPLFGDSCCLWKLQKRKKKRSQHRVLVYIYKSILLCNRLSGRCSDDVCSCWCRTKLSVCLSLSLSVCLFVCLCLSLCLSLFCPFYAVLRGILSLFIFFILASGGSLCACSGRTINAGTCPLP